MRTLAWPRVGRGKIAALLAATALLAAARGVITSDQSAKALAYMTPAVATFEFEADNLSGTTGNSVEISGERTPLTSNVINFQNVSVPVAPHLLSTGRVDAAFIAGNVGTDSREGYDDFLVRNVRLVMGDGTVVTDERYTPGRAYHVGDGVGVLEDPTDITATINQTGHLLSDTEEVLHREFRFMVPALNRTSEDAPAIPAVQPEQDGSLRVAVTDPDGDDVDVQVLGADEAQLVSTHAGSGYSKPHEESPGKTTVELPEVPGTAVSALDGNGLRTQTTQGFPTQEFTMHVDPAQIAGMPHLDVVWQGHTSPGRGATLYVRDLDRSVWEEVASVAKADEDTSLTGSIDVASTVADDGTIRLQVQEERFTPDESDFSFAWMTDTQFLSERFPQIYDSINNWIVDNAERENIIYSIHTGDITQNYNTREWEWPRASNSMAILEDAHMPYGIVTGNHDVSQTPGPQDHMYYDEYFPASRFEGWKEDHFEYGGHYGTDNRNHYDLISYGGVKFMFVYLDWASGDPEIAWANQVIKAHPDYHVVFNTHQYIDISGSYTKDGGKFFEQIIVPNDNVFMVLCGHHHGAAYNVRRVPLADGGTRVVFEVLHDYQSGPDGGSGYMRLLRVDLDQLQMDTQPYSPYTDDFDYAAEKNGGGIPEEHDDYTLALDIGAVDRELVTDRIAVLVRTGNVVAESDDIKSGSQAIVELPGTLPAGLIVRVTDPSDAVAEAPAYVTS